MKLRGGELSVVVLGGGSIGLRHLRNLQTLGVERLACFEPDAARREWAGREVPVPFFAELEQVWEFAPQAVVIAAPSQHHTPLACAAAAMGADLFIEKPLAHTLAGLDELLGLVAGKDLVSMVGCNMRFHPGPSTVKRLLDGKAVGQVVAARLKTGSYLPQWRPESDYRQSYSASSQSGGAILDCIHEIDLACWLFGPARLAAAACRPAATLGLATDGLAELLLEHEASVLSSVHLNFIQRDYRRTCEVIGSEGTIYWDFTGRTVAISRGAGTHDETFPQPNDWEINQMYVDEMIHFLQCVRDRKATCNPVSQALAVLEIAFAARERGGLTRA